MVIEGKLLLSWKPPGFYLEFPDFSDEASFFQNSSSNTGAEVCESDKCVDIDNSDSDFETESDDNLSRHPGVYGGSFSVLSEDIG